jgi:hypothetical protein
MFVSVCTQYIVCCIRTYGLLHVAAVSVSTVTVVGKNRANENADDALIVAANRLLSAAALVLGDAGGRSSLGKGGGESGGRNSGDGEEAGELHFDGGFGRRVSVLKN